EKDTRQPSRNCGPTFQFVHVAIIGHLLQSLSRTMHSPAFPFLQLARAAIRAASLSLRAAPPAYLPFSVVANAAHSLRPGRMTTLQSVVPHSLIAASAARCAVASFQLAPNLPVFPSQAIAPNSAKAGRAVSWTTPNANRVATVAPVRRCIDQILLLVIVTGVL